MVNERKMRSPHRHFPWLAALLCTLLLSACGGNTSVYFCSGTDEFCSGVRDREEDEDKTAVAAEQALTLARKTPRVIEAGLEVDQLQSVSQQSPSALGGWLLLTSLGAIFDDGDNAALSGFFDRVRVWLAADKPADGVDPVLTAGMALLAQVASERDPAVAEALSARLERRPALAESLSDAGGTWSTRTLVQELDANGECCSERALAVASLVLCGALEASERQEALQACAVADDWLRQLRQP